MIYTIFRIIFICLSFLGAIIILIKKKEMPLVISGLKKDNYDVINKENLNSVMINQHLVICFWCLFIGGISLIFEESIIFAIAALGTVIIPTYFAHQAKKYIKLKE